MDSSVGRGDTKSGGIMKRGESSAPTSSNTAKKTRRQSKGRNRLFLCPLPLRNRLPQPVPAPKLLTLPSDLSSFVDFQPTSLDREFKWKHHCERTLGINIDLVDLEKHAPPADEERPKMHEHDDRLLKWDSANTAANAEAPQRDRAFFRKTVFMARTDGAASMRSSGKSVGAKAGTSATEKEKEDAALKELIESFKTAGKKRPKMAHPSKPGVTAEWCLPVLPSVSLWANEYSLVHFDDDPGAGGYMDSNAPTAKRARLNAGLIVNAKNEYVWVFFVGECIKFKAAESNVSFLIPRLILIISGTTLGCKTTSLREV